MPEPERQHAISRAVFRFHGELNDFLPPNRRDAPIRHHFQRPASVKDIFESMGVPHPEVGSIVVNENPADFARLIRDGDEVIIYPGSRNLDASHTLPLRAPLTVYRFILDSHLGRLARYLRVLGFDALYRSDGEDKDLARISHDEERILLTRDRGLLKRREVIYGYFVRATNARLQAIEVLRRFDLFSEAAPFRRCPRCNALLQSIEKQRILDRLQAKTRQHFQTFRICSSCSRIYWEGSHYERLQRFVQETLDQTDTS